MIQTLDSLSQLPPYARVAVIINCSTRWFTTLAAASLSRFSGLPILIIDCASRDNSVEHFRAVFDSKDDTIFLYSAPLNLHGYTLDFLFRELASTEVLLMDSDLEVLDGSILSAMDAALDTEEHAYASGLFQKGSWMTPPFHHYPEGVAWYHERMWIPLTLLRTAEIKALIKRGGSFLACREYCEIVGWPRLSRWLSHRFRARGVFAAPKGAGTLIREWDTGSKMHQSLIDEGLSYAEVDPSYWSSVNHMHGVTRALISGPLFRLGVAFGLVSKSMLTNVEDAEHQVRLRLADRYADYV